MSARKSPTFSKPSLSGLRSPQGRIPASGSEERKSGARAKDGGFQPAPIMAAHQHADQGAEWGAAKEMLKMKIAPNGLLKTKGKNKYSQ